MLKIYVKIFLRQLYQNLSKIPLGSSFKRRGFSKIFFEDLFLSFRESFSKEHTATSDQT